MIQFDVHDSAPFRYPMKDGVIHIPYIYSSHFTYQVVNSNRFSKISNYTYIHMHDNDIQLYIFIDNKCIRIIL